MRSLCNIFTIYFIFNIPIYSQNRLEEISEFADVRPLLENILNNLDTSQYKVKMLFKEFGGDTFEVRNFIISNRANIDNQLYGYDFEIADLRGKDTVIRIVTKDLIYLVLTGKKKISAQNLPTKIEHGSYFENIRSNYIISEIFQPFINASSTELTIIDSSNNFYLSRKMNDFSFRHLVIDKQTLLPYMWSSIIKSQDLKMAQTLEVYFEFNKNVNSLPKNALSIDQYLSSGYKYVYSNPDTTVQEPLIAVSLLDNISTILNYPFVLPNGDTFFIENKTTKYILLDFWYASCLPCLKALPELNQLAKTYSSNEFEILAINCFDKSIKENLGEKMENNNIQIPLLFGAGDLIKSLGIHSFPTYYLVDPDRNIELIHGSTDEVKSKIHNAVNKQ